MLILTRGCDVRRLSGAPFSQTSTCCLCYFVWSISTNTFSLSLSFLSLSPQTPNICTNSFLLAPPLCHTLTNQWRRLFLAPPSKHSPSFLLASESQILCDLRRFSHVVQHTFMSSGWEGHIWHHGQVGSFVRPALIFFKSRPLCFCTNPKYWFGTSPWSLEEDRRRPSHHSLWLQGWWRSAGGRSWCQNRSVCCASVALPLHLCYYVISTRHLESRGKVVQA